MLAVCAVLTVTRVATAAEPAAAPSASAKAPAEPAAPAPAATAAPAATPAAPAPATATSPEAPATPPEAPANPAQAPANSAETPAAADSPAAASPAVSTPAPAAVVAAQAPAPATKNAIAEKFAGTYFLFRNMTSATTFSKSAYMSYNPENTLAVLMRPRFSITDRVWLSAWQYTNLELTNSDSTTRKNEVTFSDTIVSLGYTALKDKETGLTANTDFHLILPTSKAARLKTMMIGAGIGGALSWHRGIVTVSASGRGDHFFNRYTTGEYEKPWIPTCIGGECDQYSQNGVRNSEWRLMGIGSVSVAPTEWLSFSASGGEIADFLPALGNMNEARVVAGGGSIGTDATAPNWRALMYWGLGAEVRVHPALGIGIGAETYNAQLAPDSSYQRPFFNTYTAAYLELNVSPDKLPFW